MQFKDLGLNKNLVEIAEKLGFQKPTEIQSLTIPLLVGKDLDPKDVVGIAQTGTGKTAAFGLPLIQKIRTDKKSIQGLVLAPTRELALQISQALNSFISDQKIKIATIYGGAPYPSQIKQIKDGAQIVVATPGRLIDMLNRKIISLSEISIIVLDEADEMLKMGFQDDIETIFSSISYKSRQTALFSATMPNAIKKISQKYMNNPEWVQISSPTSTALNINQEYAVVQGRGKTSAANRFILASSAKGVIIFTRTKINAELVGVELSSLGLRTATISGDVPQKERERIIERMRSGKIQVLVATDVAARGIDIESIELVINYDLPDELENYIHRIGRTGRAGRSGHAISFVTPNQKSRIRQIEKITNAKIRQIDVPDQSVVRHLQTEKILNKADKRHLLGKLSQYRDAVLSHLQKIKSEAELVDFICSMVALQVGDDAKKVDENFDSGQDFDKKPQNRRRDNSKKSFNKNGKKPSKKTNEWSNSDSSKDKNRKPKNIKQKDKKKNKFSTKKRPKNKDFNR